MCSCAQLRARRGSQPENLRAASQALCQGGGHLTAPKAVAAERDHVLVLRRETSKARERNEDVLALAQWQTWEIVRAVLGDERG
jgi:hypothetical protein